LGDALAQSCNVYFFHAADQMGPAPLVNWATRFGFGRPAGIDLPGESAGRVPTPATIRDLEGHAWRAGDTQALAIGQGSLMVTPLQVARLMAAVANGGSLVTPHVVSDLGLVQLADGQSGSDESEETISTQPPQPIKGLQPSTLRIIQEGLRRVVADPAGTAYATVRLKSVSIAGKTGTAETGGGRADHAWFAGYAPADSPKVAFVVVLQHAGSGTAAAGPVAKRLVLRMQQLGYFGRQ
jgi:penicillin-binding protein 2